MYKEILCPLLFYQECKEKIIIEAKQFWDGGVSISGEAGHQRFCFGHLDNMESRLRKAESKGLDTNETLNHWEMSMWWRCVISLIDHGYLENNDKNGWHQVIRGKEPANYFVATLPTPSAPAVPTTSAEPAPPPTVSFYYSLVSVVCVFVFFFSYLH